MRIVRMRAFAPLVLLFALSAMVARGERTPESNWAFQHRELLLDKQTFRYVVYAPVAPQGAARPIVLYLHGAGAIGRDGTAQLASGLAEAIRRNPTRFPAIAVFPQATERWVTPRMERLALASLDRSAREFHADPKREYIIGYSVGAAGVWRIAYSHPHRFAALVAIAGTVRSSRALFKPDEYSADARAHAYLAAPDPYAALAARLRGVPIAIFQGADDRVVPPAESRRITGALRNLSSPVRYREFSDVGHRGVLRRALADPGLFDWMFARRASGVASLGHAERIADELRLV